MQQATLWDALDRDKRRGWRLAAIIALMVVLLIAAIALLFWALSVSGSGRYTARTEGDLVARSLEMVLRAAIPLGAIALFPLFRRRRESAVRRAIGAIPAQPGMLHESHTALYEAAIAAGVQPVPVLELFMSDSVNAFVTRHGQTMHVAVTTTFAKLPLEQQRAGFAMLMGRCRVEAAAYASDYLMRGQGGSGGVLTERRQEKPLPPAEDPVFLSCWLECASAGDREGLRILKDIRPMIALLEHLAVAEASIPQLLLDDSSKDAAFGFLAWPYPRRQGGDKEKLPLAAAVAVAEVITSERSAMKAPVLYPEIVRSQRLQAVSGIEGTFASALSGDLRKVAESRRVADAPAGRAPTIPVAGAVPVVRPVKPVIRPAERIAVSCRSCGADNAPTNRSCIACGRKLAV